ncbi:MAG: ATP-binding protein [Leptolyngbyaceae bacterium]|nr:ATP-binding protein [Leptolyngbyaceae bacterium]
MVVGDNFTSVELISLMLTDLLPVQTVGVVSGSAALEKAQEIAPDLIVIDVIMPEVYGFDVYQEFRRHSETQHLPIILTTSSTDPSYQVKAFKLGVNDYITKPFEPEELRMKVSNQLEARRAHLQLIQSDKMYALGKLLTGVAHEINNPVNFITSNVEPAQQYLRELLVLIDLYETYLSTEIPEIESYKNLIDLEYLKQDFTQLLASLKMGSNQILDIVQSLKFFAYPAETEQKEIDIHLCINNVLLLLASQFRETGDRPSIVILKSYSNPSSINGFPGQLNQVFMNLLSNAVDAIDEKAKRLVMRQNNEAHYFLPRISISTASNEDATAVTIKIADNGIGIPKNQQTQIFDQFFTTKPEGKGTGIGLSITREIIQKHRGTLSVQSEFESGTEFTVTLPIVQPS